MRARPNTRTRDLQMAFVWACSSMAWPEKMKNLDIKKHHTFPKHLESESLVCPPTFGLKVAHQWVAKCNLQWLDYTATLVTLQSKRLWGYWQQQENWTPSCCPLWMLWDAARAFEWPRPWSHQPSSTSSAVRFSGAFGDHLQADIIFVRTLNGEACPVLGMTCMSTNFHAAKRSRTGPWNRLGSHDRDLVSTTWTANPSPWMPTLFPRQEPAVAPEPWHRVRHHPNEEAWRLGKIGRRNALMRTWPKDW